MGFAVQKAGVSENKNVQVDIQIMTHDRSPAALLALNDVDYRTKCEFRCCKYKIVQQVRCLNRTKNFTFRLMFLSPTNAPLCYIYKMLKYLMIVATCFGPSGPSSGSLCRTLLKLQFCGDIQ